MIEYIPPLLLIGAGALLLNMRSANAQDYNTRPVDYVDPNKGSNDMNNPLNIRFNSANNWVGQKGQKNGFVVFDTPVNGFRAAAKLLDNYIKGGTDTIEKIISRWAPPSENPTENYIRYVVQNTGFSRISKVKRDMYVPLLLAMHKFEKGSQQYTVATIAAGVAKV